MPGWRQGRIRLVIFSLLLRGIFFPKTGDQREDDFEKWEQPNKENWKNNPDHSTKKCQTFPYSTKDLTGKASKKEGICQKGRNP